MQLFLAKITKVFSVYGIYHLQLFSGTLSLSKRKYRWNMAINRSFLDKFSSNKSRLKSFFPCKCAVSDRHFVNTWGKAERLDNSTLHWKRSSICVKTWIFVVEWSYGDVKTIITRTESCKICPGLKGRGNMREARENMKN